jgi:hypothetical protein
VFPDGVTEQDHQTSGAYVFRPYNETAQAVIIFNNWTSEEISLYEDAEVLEIEWTVWTYSDR